jgi:uracil-DNA glycosylase family 4
MQNDLFSAEMLRGPGGEAALKSLRSKALVCQKCPLHTERDKVVFGEGCHETPPIAFIGEGPGANEDKHGRPFIGPAGQLLDKQIEAMGFTREQVYICNVVCCRPPQNRKPEKAEAKACSQFLIGQLRVVRPRVIVALGASAAQALINSERGIGQLRGKWHSWTDKAKNSPVSGLTIPLRATYHPAYLLRTPKAKAAVWKDLQIVLQWLNRKEERE